LLRRNGAQVQRPGKSAGIQFADGRGFHQADATDVVVRRIEAPKQGQRVGIGWRVSPRQLIRGYVRGRAGPQNA
jgi:hypothetical protein